MNINRFMANVDNMARSNKFSVNIFGPSGLSTQYKDILGTGLLDSARMAMGKTHVLDRSTEGMSDEEWEKSGLGATYDGVTSAIAARDAKAVAGLSRDEYIDEVVAVAKPIRRKLEWTMGKNNFSMRGLRCTNITLPGKSFITTPHTNWPGGPKTNRIQGVDHEGGLIQMTFLCDHTFEEKEKLELWQEYIHDDAYYYQYYDNIHGSVQIQQNGQDGLPIYAVELNEAYPQALQAQTLDAASNDVQRLTVTFAYKSWTSSFSRTPTGLLDGFFDKQLRKLDTKISRKLDKILGF